MKISTLYLSVLMLALVIKIVTANVGSKRSPQQYCSSKLADVMRALCSGKYNQKRTRMDSEFMDYKDLEDNAIDYPYGIRQEAMSFMPPRFLRSPRTRTRIIDECCKKPCHLTELQSYCAH